MEIIGSALGIIAVIVVIVLIVKFVRFLFLNILISRVLSAVAALVSIILALTHFELWQVLIPMTALSWCFFIGPVIFDVEYDGTYRGEVEDVDDTHVRVTVTPNKTGGFFANVALSLVIVGAVYFIFGAEYPAVLVVIPIIMLLLDAWHLFKIFLYKKAQK